MLNVSAPMLPLIVVVVSEAVLLQAQAEFKQGMSLQAQAEFKQQKLTQAIALLDARKAGAGHFADQYVYWIGEAQFQNADPAAAAETFISLARDFPESPLRLQAVVGPTVKTASIPSPTAKARISLVRSPSRSRADRLVQSLERASNSQPQSNRN